MLVDGGWGEWEDFGPCSKTCDDGIKVRLRDCNQPRPRDGGLYCFGFKSDLQNCETDRMCPGKRQKKDYHPVLCYAKKRYFFYRLCYCKSIT